MIKIIAENKARQGRWGRHGLRILVAALLLAFVAWGVAAIYGEVAKSPTTEQGTGSGGG